jgi:hypothetical protein
MASLSTLIEDAVLKGRATASDGRWRAYRQGDEVIVRHFSTDMIAVCMTTMKVRPISEGWGSMTDKVGIGKVLRGAGLPGNYFTVFGGRS